MKLYTEKILKLATEIPHLGRINNAEKEIQLRSPICGSSIAIYVNTCQGKVREFKQEVKTCALGQASAAILAANVVGIDLKAICELRSTVKEMLEKNSPPPPPPFSAYKLLRPACEFKNRHASIMLVLDATKKALEEL